MNRDKQIEEISEILVNGCKMGGCEECKYNESVFPQCTLKYTADQLYNAGYRKASEVIEDLANRGLLNVEPWGIEDLKKKYTEGDDG